MTDPISGQAIVYVVDDDEGVRASLRFLLSKVGWQVQTFADIESFQNAFDPNRIGCCIFDLRIGEENGIDLAHYLNSLHSIQPFIFLTGFGTIAVAVESMKLGASHFLEKPVDATKLLTLVQDAVVSSSQAASDRVLRIDLVERRNSLSTREREVMNLLIEGMLSKQIASKLGISCKTVEVHKTNLKRKLGVRSTVELLKYRD